MPVHLLHRPSIRPAIAAVALVATIGLAACGSDAKDQPSDQPSTPPTEQMTDTTVAAMSDTTVAAMSDTTTP